MTSPIPPLTDRTAELLARCAEIAVQLEDIGEAQHAADVRALIEAYVIELAGGRPLSPVNPGRSPS